MKKLFIPIAASVLAGAVACADLPTSTSTATDDAALNRGNGNGGGQQSEGGSANGGDYNGPTYVLGEFGLTIEIAGEAFAPGENAHPQGKGECRDESGNVNENSALNIVWHDAGQGKAGTGTNFCAGSEGESEPVVLACTINEPGIPATYAAAGSSLDSGNENLNFVTDEEVDLFVHYRANRESTDAKGILELSYTCEQDVEGTATIDLGQWAGAGSPFGERTSDSRQLEIDGQTVVTDLGDGELESLYWVFRSRVESE